MLPHLLFLAWGRKPAGAATTDERGSVPATAKTLTAIAASILGMGVIHEADVLLHVTGGGALSGLSLPPAVEPDPVMPAKDRRKLVNRREGGTDDSH